MDFELIRIKSKTLLSTSVAVVGLALAIVGGFNLLQIGVAGVDPILTTYRQLDAGVAVVDGTTRARYIHVADIILIGVGSAVAYISY